MREKWGLWKNSFPFPGGTCLLEGGIAWIRRQRLEHARIAPTDMDIIQVLDDPQAIVDTVRKLLVI